MESWLPLAYRSAASDGWEFAISFGALFLNAMGVILVFIIFACDLGLTSQHVRDLASDIWLACGLVLLGAVAYNHWCRPRRPLLRTYPSLRNADRGNHPYHHPPLAEEVSGYKICNSFERFRNWSSMKPLTEQIGC